VKKSRSVSKLPCRCKTIPWRTSPDSLPVRHREFGRNPLRQLDKIALESTDLRAIRKHSLRNSLRAWNGRGLCVVARHGASCVAGVGRPRINLIGLNRLLRACRYGHRDIEAGSALPVLPVAERPGRTADACAQPWSGPPHWDSLSARMTASFAVMYVPGESVMLCSQSPRPEGESGAIFRFDAGEHLCLGVREAHGHRDRFGISHDEQCLCSWWSGPVWRWRALPAQSHSACGRNWYVCLLNGAHSRRPGL
jgi:hypothetical protein